MLTARYEEADHFVYLKSNENTPLILLKFLASLFLHRDSHDDEKLKDMCEKMHGLVLEYCHRGKMVEKSGQPLDAYFLDKSMTRKAKNDSNEFTVQTVWKYSIFYELTQEQHHLKELIVQADGFSNGDYLLSVHQQELFSEKKSHNFLSGLWFYEPFPVVHQRQNHYSFKFRKHFADQHASRLPRFIQRRDIKEDGADEKKEKMIDVPAYLSSFRVVKRGVQ